jgi:hypothetical protein
MHQRAVDDHPQKVVTYDLILHERSVSYVTASGGGTQAEFDSGHGSLSSKPSMAVSGTQITEVVMSGGHSSWNAVWSMSGF